MDVDTHKRFAAGLFLFAILFLMVSGIISFYLYDSNFNANNEVVKSYQTIRTANQFLITLDQANLAVASLLLEKNINIEKKFPLYLVAIKLYEEHLESLVNDDPAEMTLYKQLKPLIAVKIENLQTIIKLYHSGHREAALEYVKKNHKLMLTDKIMSIVLSIKNIEIGQLDIAMPDYLLGKARADLFFISFGMLNILLLCFIYFYIRCYQ